MAKIILKDPKGLYKAVIDTEGMTAELREVFQGVFFTTENGSQLGVSIRDNGFEVSYNGKMYRFVNGVIAEMVSLDKRTETQKE